MKWPHSAILTAVASFLSRAWKEFKQKRLEKKANERLTKCIINTINRTCNSYTNKMKEENVILYRPVGPKELALIEASGFEEFPPRLPEQPIFYPVLNEEYARQIARDWNAKDSGAGYVTRFALRKCFASKYPVQKAGGAIHLELWIPAGELAEMNRNIVGKIEVIAEYRAV